MTEAIDLMAMTLFKPASLLLGGTARGWLIRVVDTICFSWAYGFVQIAQIHL